MILSEAMGRSLCACIIGSSAAAAAACWTIVPTVPECGDPASGGTLVCDGVEYPSWKVRPGVISICSSISTPAGENECTNGATLVYAQLETYACDFDGFPYVVTSVNYGEPCASAQLSGGNCGEET